MKKIKSRKKRIQNKRWLIKCGGFFLVLLMFYCGIYVDAGMNDSIIERNRVENVYAIAKVNGVDRIFYLNMHRMNGRVAYCIELGVDITSDIYHSTSDFSISYLSAEQIEYIRAVSYFGYGYEGRNDYRYYMAAQEMIWEHLNKINVEWSHELDINGVKMDISPYKTNIRTLIDRYYKNSSFEWRDEQNYTVGTKITLSDIEKVLSDYEVIDSGHADVTIDGNKLIIDVATDYIGTETIILKKKNFYDYDSSLYYYDTSQKLISSGNFKDSTKTLSFQIIGVNMNVQVIDKDTGLNKPLGQASLEGAKYELYNSSHELVGAYETDSDGKFLISNLPYGDYYLKQIEASEGYLVNQKEVKVEFYDNNFELKIEQKVISNEVEIKKVYGNDGNYEVERDVLFQIYDINGNLYQEIVTDENGLANIWLPYGKYQIHQINTILGYEKVEDFEIIVREKKEEKVYYNLINEFMKCRVKINTIENESKNLVIGNGLAYRIKKSGEDNYLEVDGENVFFADDGVLILPMLFSYGDYVLEQVEVPTGMLLNKNSVEFTIDEHTELMMSDQRLFVEIVVCNQLIKGNIHILANKEEFYFDMNNYGYEKIPRQDKSFLLIANQDIVVNGEVRYEEGEEIEELVTNKDGMASIKNLYLGHYCLIGQENEEKQCFILKNINNDKEFIDKNLEFTLVLEKSDIILQNRDELGKNIQGSIWEVLDKDNNIIYTGITNDDGIIQIKDLVNGEYCIRQKSVLVSYHLIKNKKCISLNDNQTLNLINQSVKKNSIWVPNTFSNKIDRLMFMHIIGLIGTIVVVYKKIFVSK